VLRNNKLLIIGGDSKIGKILRKTLKEQKINFKFTSKKKLLSNNAINFHFQKKNLKKIEKLFLGFDRIIYCLALKDTKFCQDYPDKSFFINYFLPYYIAKKFKYKFMFFQTDIKKNKFLNYSKHKMKLETSLKKYSNRIKIITIGKIPSKNNLFIKKIKNLIKNEKEILINKQNNFLITCPFIFKRKIVPFIFNNQKRLQILSKKRYNYFNFVLKFYFFMDIDKEKFTRLSKIL
jgi:hypothetical protein